MGKHQIMSVQRRREELPIGICLQPGWGQMPTTERGLSAESLRLCGRNESFGIVFCRVLSVFESDWLHWLQDGRFDDGTE